MGAGAIVVLHVDDNPKDPNYGVGFLQTLFPLKKEWLALKKLCNENNIYQTDLDKMFKRYLNDDAAMLRDMKVSLGDLSEKFLGSSVLRQEICMIFIPLIFHKPFIGLIAPSNLAEISFSRFIIMGYIFCVQPLTDVIFDFFSVLKQNFNMKVEFTIFTFNLQQILMVLSEDQKRSAAMKYLIDNCHMFKEEEITIEKIILLNFKYPLMFYELYRFRNLFRRFIFGQRFWSTRTFSKSQFPKFIPFSQDPGYTTEKQATVATSRAIIFDICSTSARSSNGIDVMTDAMMASLDDNLIEDELSIANKQARLKSSTVTTSISHKASGRKKKNPHKHKSSTTSTGTEHLGKALAGTLALADTFSSPTTTLNTIPIDHSIFSVNGQSNFLSQENCIRVKQRLGYKQARKLIHESEFNYPDSQLFLRKLDYSVDIRRAVDPLVNREFIYDLNTGMRAWAQKYYATSTSKKVLRETFYKTGPDASDAAVTDNYF